MKQTIFNLIIIDESGSMGCIKDQTINGCNETIDTIVEAQKQFAETQEHYISVYAFNSLGSKDGSRYVMHNVKVQKESIWSKGVRHMSDSDYHPCGCTPLNDAVGMTLTQLYEHIKDMPDAVGSVTIITDGEENASHHYSTNDVASIISQLKEKGWGFNFIGANINVVETASTYNIENCIEFKQTDEGTKEMFERERRSKMAYMQRIEEVAQNRAQMSEEEYMERRRMAAQGYYEEHPTVRRATPEHIEHLRPNEIFVFGSNVNGKHAGGASRLALERFGAVMGQAEGMQGQSYAIPSVGVSKEEMQAAILRFIRYASNNEHYTFMVTRIGCGHGGWSEREVAQMFVRARGIKNIVLPKEFMNYLQY